MAVSSDTIFKGLDPSTVGVSIDVIVGANTAR